MKVGLILLILALPVVIPVVLAFVKIDKVSRRSILFFKNKAALAGVSLVALLAAFNLVLYQMYVAGECGGAIDSGVVCGNYPQSIADFIKVSQFFALIYLIIIGAPALVLLLFAEILTRLLQKK